MRPFAEVYFSLTSACPRRNSPRFANDPELAGPRRQARQMTARTPLPEDLPQRSFSVGAALALGTSASRLRGGDLDRPFWGIRSPAGSTADLAARALAYFSRSGPAILSHISAARMWGIPLPGRWEKDDRLHVSVPPDRRAPRGVGVVGHHIKLHPIDGVICDGVLTTSQPRTLCDLASLLGEEDLLAAADYLIWRRRGDEDRVARAEIAAAIARHPTTRGIRRLRRIEPMASDRSDSAPESKIRFRIARAMLPAPAVNLELHDSWGNFLAMPDLSYPEFTMALDYEGDHHRTDAAQWEKDIHRVPRLQDAGWHHTRISRSDLANSNEFLARLARNLRARGWNP
jgi:hypothetical protein